MFETKNAGVLHRFKRNIICVYDDDFLCME